MRNKRFVFDLACGPVTVEADAEGIGRYMVRITVPNITGRIRIGYLTGAGNAWIAEFLGGRPDQRFTSAKAACLALAEISLPKLLEALGAQGAPQLGFGEALVVRR